MGLVCVPASLCFAILLTIAPESPAWLMSKAKDKGQLISEQYFFSPSFKKYIQHRSEHSRVLLRQQLMKRQLFIR